MERIPIVIDTDPGIDDFFCLALACAYSDRLDLRAVTTMGGNNHTERTATGSISQAKQEEAPSFAPQMASMPLPLPTSSILSPDLIYFSRSEAQRRVVS